MYNRNQFLDKSAQGVLDNHKREAEERKLAMMREQRARELKQLETELYYKKQEVARLKSLFDRLRREAVVKQNTANREKSELNTDQRQIKETEGRLQALDQEVARALSEISDKITKEKAVIAEHQRNLENLEKQKRETQTKKEREKKTFAESMSRLLFAKKREEQEAKRATDSFATNQTQLHAIEQSLKQFSQEVTVLENKIRSMRNTKI